MSKEQYVELANCINKTKELIRLTDAFVTGFNIGINEGKDAGQTVMHFHCHVIPRRRSDMSSAGELQNIKLSKEISYRH
jgi:diadenosine tetraphosphate (Ap4A) HIT family hydrolase